MHAVHTEAPANREREAPVSVQTVSYDAHPVVSILEREVFAMHVTVLAEADCLLLLRQFKPKTLYVRLLRPHGPDGVLNGHIMMVLS